jgi:protein-L-isoaspartate(D-aspartate) O-methyltransferase
MRRNSGNYHNEGAVQRHGLVSIQRQAGMPRDSSLLAAPDWAVIASHGQRANTWPSRGKIHLIARVFGSLCSSMKDTLRFTGNEPPGACADFESKRRDMVARQIRDRGVHDERVLDAMQAVPRHVFVPDACIRAAYSDDPLPIGEGQTISQPFMVAAMAQALSLIGHERVLEVGAGSGYQAAILSRLAREVIAVETQTALADSARARLRTLGFSNVYLEVGDGSVGWALGAPYDAILVSAAAPAVPQALIDQLRDGGRLVIPVGGLHEQELLRIVKRDGRTYRESLYMCRFVPLTGRHGWPQNSPKANFE